MMCVITPWGRVDNEECFGHGSTTRRLSRHRERECVCSALVDVREAVEDMVAMAAMRHFDGTGEAWARPSTLGTNVTRLGIATGVNPAFVSKDGMASSGPGSNVTWESGRPGCWGLEPTASAFRQTCVRYRDGPHPWPATHSIKTFVSSWTLVVMTW